MLRAIREIQPRWVVGENVLGLVNWNGGLVFNEVQADLEAEGYEVQPYVLPAVSVNAPHRRDRVWFVAYSNGNGLNQCNCYNEVNTSKGRINALGNIVNGSINGNSSNTQYEGLEGQYREWEGCTKHRSDKGIFVGSENKLNAADTNSRGLEGSTEVGWYSEYAIGKDGTTAQTRNVTNTDSISNQTRTQREILGQSYWEKTNGYSNVERRNQWENFPTVSPICTGDDGISDRLDSITFPKWRNESIKAGGNAIVPQVVYQIFKTIEQYERINTPDKNS